MAGVESIKKQGTKIEIRLSPEGTAKTDGAKLMAESMEFGRAVGFSMDADQLLLTVDERHTGKKTGFDVLEAYDEASSDCFQGNNYFYFRLKDMLHILPTYDAYYDCNEVDF